MEFYINDISFANTYYGLQAAAGDTSAWMQMI